MGCWGLEGARFPSGESVEAVTSEYKGNDQTREIATIGVIMYQRQSKHKITERERERGREREYGEWKVPQVERDA